MRRHVNESILCSLLCHVQELGTIMYITGLTFTTIIQQTPQSEKKCNNILRQGKVSATRYHQSTILKPMQIVGTNLTL